MKKRISKSECTRKTEWNRPFLKILTFWSNSKFYLVKAFFFLFLFIYLFIFFADGSDWVIFLGQSNRLVGDYVISDVIALEGTCKCVAG